MIWQDQLLFCREAGNLRCHEPTEHHSSVIVPPIHDESSSASLMRKLFLHVAITFQPFNLQSQYIEQHVTLPETNVAPENGWLEYYFPIGEAYFQGLLLLVSGRVP